MAAGEKENRDLLGPRVTPPHNNVHIAALIMVGKQGLTRSQIIFLHSVLLCLEQTLHTQIYS